MSKTPDFDLHTEYPTSLLKQALPRPDEGGDDISLETILAKTNALVAGVAKDWEKPKILDALMDVIDDIEILLDEGEPEEIDPLRSKAEQCLRIVNLEWGYDSGRSAKEIEDAAFLLMHRPNAEVNTRLAQLEAHAGCSKCPQMFHAGTKAIWNQHYFCGDCASK